jgi:transcriptional regulator with PAS, ATPase and Fis domain
MKTAIDVQLNNYDTIAKDSKTAKKPFLRRDIENQKGKGKVISAVLDMVEKYAGIDKPLLIEGETGTGKELIANYIGRLSGRKVLTINCAAISKELVNSELFGSVKGAFTDAQNKKGFIEAIDGGILFFDEFNSLPLDTQANLLRFIENKTFIKVGDTTLHTSDIRIIAAGNKSFKELVKKGELREDLYARFIKTIYIPTLKERSEDFDYFIDRFIAEANKMQGKTTSISDEARKILESYDWSKNIRQLKNVIEILVIEVEPDKLSKKCIIKPQFVRKCIEENEQKCLDDFPEDDYTLQTAHDVVDKKAILRALNKVNGNNSEAIKLLQISPTTYYKFKKRFEIE